MPPILLPRPIYLAESRSLIPRVSAAASNLSKRSASSRLGPIPIPASNPNRDAFAIVKRQAIGLIPTGYKFDGPGAGTVVGIVLGSVAGFLLVVILFWLVSNRGSTGAITADEEIVVRRRDRSPHRSHRSRHSRSDRVIREVREVSRSPRRPGRTIVEERVERVRDRTPSGRSGFIVDERVESSRPSRRVEGDDRIEVTEYSEVSPPRRNRSRRSDSYRDY